ncbi:MAG: mechanosensitive ion channel family protein [Victivallales bacterium]|nr:mechanosensitive ion channel family protein [Victivallales bacterium]
MKNKLFICLTALVCITGSTLFAEPQKAEIDAPAKTLSLQSANIIVVSDAKDVEKLVSAIKAGQKQSGQLTDGEKEKAESRKRQNIWQLISGETRELWDKLTAMKIISMSNLYFLIGGLFATFLAVAIMKWFLHSVIAKRLTSRTKSDVDDQIIVAITPPLALMVYSLGSYLSIMKIIIHAEHHVFDWAGRITLALIAASLVWGVYRMLEILIAKMISHVHKTDTKVDDLILILLRKSLRLALVIVSALLIGENILGMNITALLAGAGIFGLAIAFAAQDTIANFFGSIMIIFDKPFSVGERIKVGDISGVVENVGFRSTKLATLDGHYITLPNKKITESAIENIARRPYIKFVMNLTLVYETTPEKMQQAMDILREILHQHEGMKEDMEPKIFFSGFNDWSLNLMCIVWYHPGDWAAANTWYSRVNLEILRRFNAAEIGFAFPSNTTYLVNGRENIKISMDQKVN